MSHINREIDPFLERCGFNLERFVKFLKSEGVKQQRLTQEFPDDGRQIWHSRIIGEPLLDEIQILDGSHRAVILALRSDNDISCYVRYEMSA